MHYIQVHAHAHRIRTRWRKLAELNRSFSFFFLPDSSRVPRREARVFLPRSILMFSDGSVWTREKKKRLLFDTRRPHKERSYRCRSPEVSRCELLYIINYYAYDYYNIIHYCLSSAVLCAFTLDREWIRSMCD